MAVVTLLAPIPGILGAGIVVSFVVTAGACVGLVAIGLGVSERLKAQPMSVWAVADASQNTPADWYQPHRAGIRLLPDDDRDAAVRRVERRLGVTSSSDRVLIHWVADPAAAQWSAWLTLLRIIGAGGACWVLLVFAFGRSPARAGGAR
jgi:hypothetical protein